MRGVRYIIAIALFLGVLPTSSYPMCAAFLRHIANSQNENTPTPWRAEAKTTSDRMKLLVSLLERHPNIVTSNLSSKRSLLDTYAHVPGLLEALGENAASFTTDVSSVRRLRYVASGGAQYNEEAIKTFKEARISEIEALDLLDGEPLAVQFQHLKDSSKNSDGSYSEKLFKRNVRKFLQVLPLLFDADGSPRFGEWSTDRKNIITEVQGLKPSEIENRYGDLLKEHLSKLIDEISSARGLGQIKIIFDRLQGEFVETEVRSVLTPVSETGGVLQERHLSLEALPAFASLIRGCYGGDCSILSVPYHSAVKGAKTYFVRKSHDLSEQPAGYAFVVAVEVNGKTLPYIITINGISLTSSDIEMVVRGIAEDYGVSEVVLPDFKKNANLVNSAAARSGMTTERRRNVRVEFPPGWSAVDAYTRNHKISGYNNYYEGPSIEDAYLSQLPSKDQRLLDSESETTRDVPYRQVEELLEVPLIQRAILGVQALSDRETRVGEVSDVLHLTEAQIQAARPLTELSSTRALKFSEYQNLQEELGFNLKDLLELESGARAASLRSLYAENANLFSEHGIRRSPKGINALVEAYGPLFADEVRMIIGARDLSDAKALQLLQALKPALSSGDLKRALHFKAQLKGSSLEAWSVDALPKAFIRMNPAETALGRKLEEALRSNELGEKDFARSALRISSPRESAMFQAFQDVTTLMEARGLSFEAARDQWLQDKDSSIAAKARYLGMKLNSPQFNDLVALVPNTQRAALEREINQFSFFQFFSGNSNRGVRVSQPGVLNRIFGSRESVQATKAPSNLVIESFEFVDAGIPEGGVSFTMGSPPSETGRRPNEPLTEVTLTKNFQMQAAPVTQWQYEAVMGKNPANFSKGADALNRPVESVSYPEAEEFIRRLHQLNPNRRFDYRLPTEAEWEYMVRAGTRTAYSFGNDISELPDFGHFSENSQNQTQPVAGKRPNAFGLYDMHGNVGEWQRDWYAEAPGGGVDPEGTAPGSGRVIRGGSWYYGAEYLRSALRNYGARPGYRYDSVGFRLVRTPR